MKFTANLSLLYPEYAFLERFAAAASDGFQAVEIQFPYDTPAADIHRELDKHQLECVLINVPAGDLMTGGAGLACVSGQEQAFEDALQQCLEYVRVLKPQYVNVLAGRAAPEEREAALQVLQSNLMKASRLLGPEGVQVTLEAINTFDMPDFLITNFRDMQAVIDACPEKIAMQFDIYHMARMGEPVAALLVDFGAAIGHIQFADVPGRHEPGTGELDFQSLWAAAEMSGYQGWYGAEYRPQGSSTSSGLGWLKALQNRSN